MPAEEDLEERVARLEQFMRLVLEVGRDQELPCSVST